MSQWLEKLKNAKKSCVQQGNLKKVHYALEDGNEMVEEYNTETGVLTRRAWKKKTKLGGDCDWEIEIGDPQPKQLNNKELVLEESANQPFVTRRITKTNLEWRIRNLPYALDNYSVSADPENSCLVVRTKNKKYFKKLEVPELTRANVLAEQDNISFSHKFNTLIITYKKPQEVIDMEKRIYEDVNSLKAKNSDECKPS